VPPVSVLVVDDDPVIVRLLQVNFELEGIDVSIAMDGEEGFLRATAHPPDVIISDIMMPKLNGLELLAALRAAPAVAGIPVILLSAKAQAADVQRGLELGADDYVTKPFDPLELIDRVYKVLAKSRR
jgi:DNA-binding response OmpR family regulator